MERSEPLTGVKQPPAPIRGFLLIGHGTRSQLGQQQFRQVFQLFAQILSNEITEMAFLELAEPDIETAVRRLADKNVRQLVTVPLLLFSAGHAKRDIPQEVDYACKEVGISVVSQSTSLGCATQILELSAARFRQAVCLQNESVQCKERCGSQFCPRIGLAMIGRGSRSEQATEHMRLFTKSRCKLTPVQWQITGFIHGQTPTVVEALDALQETENEIAVVQPHLLFEGELMENLRAQVAERQRIEKHRKWVITNSLGVDFRLAKSLALLATQQPTPEPSS